MRWRVNRLVNRFRGTPDAYDVEHSHFWVRTADGVKLAGTRLGSDDRVAVVIAHGFMAYRTKRPWRVLAQGLAERFSVLTFDLRGHGQSDGACTGGEQEMHDVHAVVQWARAKGYSTVVTVGGSLGGIAVIREAATYADPDAVVAISTPALWGTSDSKAVRQMQFLFMSRIGRALAKTIMGTRIHMNWGDPEPPAEMVGRISPIPLLIVHGADDHFFPPSDAELLYERAGEPKSLLIKDTFGHSEDGFTPAFADELIRHISALVAPQERAG